MALYPSINDAESDLWKKIAQNWYEYATGLGITGIEPPSWNDNRSSLVKKIANYTALIADLP